ncbi:hypothetical protein [Corynebacterium xerosis]|uniref:hypothetical protein n=1 Tax=Corynebacterium xerosis TaxID=1725 RepID=UPI00387960EA
MTILAAGAPTADSFLADGDFWSNVLIGGLVVIAIASWRTRSMGRLIPRVLLWGFTWFIVMIMGAGCDTAAGKFEQMQNETASDPAAGVSAPAPSPTHDPSRDSTIPNIGLNPNGAFIPDPAYMPERPADW